MLQLDLDILLKCGINITEIKRKPTCVCNEVDVAYQSITGGSRKPRKISVANADGNADVAMRVDVVVIVESRSDAIRSTDAACSPTIHWLVPTDIGPRWHSAGGRARRKPRIVAGKVLVRSRHHHAGVVCRHCQQTRVFAGRSPGGVMALVFFSLGRRLSRHNFRPWHVAALVPAARLADGQLAVWLAAVRQISVASVVRFPPLAILVRGSVVAGRVVVLVLRRTVAPVVAATVLRRHSPAVLFVG